MKKQPHLIYGIAAAMGAVLAVAGCECGQAGERAGPRYALAIHGGAGTILPGDMTAEKEREYRAALDRALQTGQSVLAGGGTSLDAVVATIALMEDSPLFNAGKGAVFTAEGKNELDASIMDGKTRRAGAVAGVTTVKNPIHLARAVMEKSIHVMLQGPGAEAFAREQGIEFADPSYFHTEWRWQKLQEAIQKESQKKNDGKSGKRVDPGGGSAFGTVGAVALDIHGNLAAATSTGGMTNKRWGRVGDSPIIGAGTYADNRSCAVSGTGHGEYFIRATVARDVCALVEYRGLGVKEAATKVVHETLIDMGGSGGVIALDSRGEVALVFNTPGMYRGHLGKNGERIVAIYQDEARDDSGKGERK